MYGRSVGLKVVMIDALFLKGKGSEKRAARQLDIKKMNQYTDDNNLVQALALRTVCRALHAECRPHTICEYIAMYRWTE